MLETKVRDTVEVLLAVDVDAVDRDGLAALVARSHELRCWLASFDVRCARRTKALAAAGRAESSSSMMGNQGRRSSREAAAVAAREAVCAAMPDVEAGLSSGAITSGHVDAIAAGRRDLDAGAQGLFDARVDDLLAAAASERLDGFAKTVREFADRAATAAAAASCPAGEPVPDPAVVRLERQKKMSRLKRWRDHETGMCHTHVELDPERDAILAAALRTHLRRAQQADGNTGTPWQQLEVESFVAAVAASVTRPAAARSTAGDGSAGVASAGGRSGGGVSGGGRPGGGVSGGGGCGCASAGSVVGNGAGDGEPEAVVPDPELRVPEIGVLVDLDTLCGLATGNGVCETFDGTPLPIDTVRRLCCDAEIVPIVLGGRGEVLDVGRSSRTPTRAQRRALRAMHRTCASPDCTVGFESCTIHHVRFWTAHRGPTDLDNLVPLCSRCHHRVHEGGWTLTMTADRVATWTRPDGVVHHTGSTIDRTRRAA